ncbi:hypothetical protein O181_014821 [Austropuccinia psidii MF-1]|uniref:Uncharacterized protein n=1 Tax=Austropuccinia psidii MF-1 TaxID=1389203 RepID=A0A9Q3GPH4_9BASI|nr:hypothetical protein [Austropuccinia psidii MF-1]
MGMTNWERVRLLPKIPIPCNSLHPPKGLLVDFDNVKCFKNLSNFEKQSTVDMKNISFLPNPVQALSPQKHPYEKISNKALYQKYSEIVLKSYPMEDDENVEEDNEEQNGDSIDLEGESPDASGDEINGFFEPVKYDYEDD